MKKHQSTTPGPAAIKACPRIPATRIVAQLTVCHALQACCCLSYTHDSQCRSQSRVVGKPCSERTQALCCCPQLSAQLCEHLR